MDPSCGTSGQWVRSTRMGNGSISENETVWNPARSSPRSRPPMPEKNEACPSPAGAGSCVTEGNLQVGRIAGSPATSIAV